MKKLFVLLALLCLMNSPAQAGKDEKVNELIELAYYQTMNSMLEPMLQQMTSPIECSYALDENAEKELKNDIKKVLLTIQLKTTNIIKPFYADNFTEAELDELLASYKSPAMQKMMKLSPKIAQESMTSMQKLMGEITPQLIAVFQKVEGKYPARPAEEQASCIQKKLKRNP